MTTPSFSYSRSRCAAWITFALLIAGAVPSANAAFHLWYIEEAYSNQSGTVQFIELFTNSASQEFLNSQTLTSSTKTFTFPSNSASPTNGHHLLLATSGFGSISGGATPDFTLPNNFFSATGDTLTFAPSFGPNGVDKKTFASAPTDGINSLNYTAAFSASLIAVNSPRNYAGNGTSISLAAPSGDYNGNHVVDAADYVAWRDTLNQSVSTPGHGADGNADGTVNAADYTYWRARFGNSAGSGSSLGASAVPEPAAAVFAAISLAFAWLRRRASR